MKQIPLTIGMFTLVDDEDFEELSKYNWQATKPTNNNNYYATRWNPVSNGKRRSIKMHRVLLKLTDPNIKGDHIDHNSLNNQKCNLRLSSPLENGRNKSSHKNSSSKYLGVHKHVRKEKTGIYTYWKAQLNTHGKYPPTKQFSFTNEGEIFAAMAYDEMAKKHFGEFANLNFNNNIL